MPGNDQLNYFSPHRTEVLAYGVNVSYHDWDIPLRRKAMKVCQEGVFSWKVAYIAKEMRKMS